QLHTDGRRQSFAYIVACQVRVRLLQLPRLASILIESAGKRRAEARYMRAAVYGVDAIGEREERFAVAVVVLQRHLDHRLVAFALNVDWPRHHHVAVLVQVANEGLQAAVEVEGDLLLTLLALIYQLDGQAAVEVRHLAEALGKRLEGEVVGLHDGEV